MLTKMCTHVHENRSMFTFVYENKSVACNKVRALYLSMKGVVVEVVLASEHVM